MKPRSSKNFEAVKRKFLEETESDPCRIFWLCHSLGKKEKRFFIQTFDDSNGQSAFIHDTLCRNRTIIAGSKEERKVNKIRLFILQLCIEMTKRVKKK